MASGVGEELRLAPTAMVAGGAALARDGSGRVVFVEGALPGETVTARLIETRADYARAELIEVLEASPDRIFPPCPTLRAGCGGCTWQHVAPAAQVRLKADILLDALRRIGRLAEPPEPQVMALAEPVRRTTARLGVTPEGRAGYRPRRGPGVAVPTDTCLAAHPLVEELITGGRYRGAREVLLRAGVASGEQLARISPAGAKTHVEVPAGVVVVGDDERSAWVHETVAGRSFRVGVGSFFQPGPVAAEALVAAAREALGDGAGMNGVVVDAYGGVGLFAACIAGRLDARVTLIESDRSAVADARVNLADMNARVVALDVGRWRPRQGEAAVDVMIADPPRPGLGRPGVATVAAAGAARLVLVSCDPASLARDVVLLGGAGYRLVSATIVDAFPHTFHMETVSRFDRIG